MESFCEISSRDMVKLLPTRHVKKQLGMGLDAWKRNNPWSDKTRVIPVRRTSCRGNQFQIQFLPSFPFPPFFHFFTFPYITPAYLPKIKSIYSVEFKVHKVKNGFIRSECLCVCFFIHFKNIRDSTKLFHSLEKFVT